MTLNNFFQNCEDKSSHLFREFLWILSEKFKISETKLISGELLLNKDQQDLLNTWIQKRKQDYPLQYFLGSSDFMGLDFSVSDGVLIPRNETEEIGLWVVNQLKDREVGSLMDIGTGSGCLGIGVARALKSLNKLTLIEPFGDGSLEKNIKSLCDGQNFETNFFPGTFEEYKFTESYDVILSNPPYIRYEDPDVAKGVYEHEPHEALFGGALGWEKEVTWAHKAYENLKPEGLLVFEFSHDQKEILTEKLEEYSPEFHKDQFDRDRFFSIVKRSN